jgi:hypothetical protein
VHLTIEIAKYCFIEDSEVLTLTISTVFTLLELNQISIIEKYAFTFNINNVLIHSREVLSEAIKIIKLLNRQNEFNIKVYIVSGSYILYNIN